MEYRPSSITTIAILIIIGSVFSFTGILRNLDDANVLALLQANSVPPNVYWGATGANCLVGLISAIGMLNGENWARILYLGWRSAFIVFELVALPMGAFSFLSIVPIAITIIFAIILFRPDANKYFAGPAALATE